MSQQVEVMFFPESGPITKSYVLVEPHQSYRPKELEYRIMRTTPENADAKCFYGFALEPHYIGENKKAIFRNKKEIRKFLLIFYKDQEQNSPTGAINLNYQQWFPSFKGKIDPELTWKCGPIYVAYAKQPDISKMRYEMLNISEIVK